MFGPKKTVAYASGSEMFFPAADMDPSHETGLSWKQWLIRIGAAFAFGNLWCFVVTVFWLGLFVAPFGDLDLALKNAKLTPNIKIGSAGYFTSAPASCIGGFLGPIFLAGATNLRRYVIWSSALGAGVSTAVGVGLGLSSAWYCLEVAPQTMLYAEVALTLSIHAGVFGGWVGGRYVRWLSERRLRQS